MASENVKFTYNGLEYQVEGKHDLNLADGKGTFGADFIVAVADAAALKTAVDAVIAAYTVNDAAFLLKVGSQTLLTFDDAVNTGFLQRPKCVKKGLPADTGRSQRLRFELELEFPPGLAARAGRREASINLLAEDPDYIRTLEFKGTWTATKSGAPSVQSAKAAFDAGVAAWIATWTSAITPTGSWVLQSHLSLEWDDENKVLKFHTRYREFSPTVNPTETSLGVYTIGRFTRNDPELIGQPLLNQSGPNYRQGNTAAAGSPTANPSPNNRLPRRYTAKTKTFFRDSTIKPNGYWESTVRAWIAASVKAIFGDGRVIFERTVVTGIDVEEKAIECDSSILIATTGLIVEYEETVTRIHDPRRIAETVWSGEADDFDIQEGGRQLWIRQTVRQKRLDQAPVEPSTMGAPWVFWHEENPQTAWVIDPVTDAIVAVQYTHNRLYLYSPNAGRRGGGGRTTASSFLR